MDKVRTIIQEVEELKSKKEFEKAIKILEDSLVENNNDYRLYEEIADIYLYEGKNQKALKAIDFALSLNSESATGNYLKGFILLAKNKFEQSIDFLEKSNTNMPNNAEVLRNLGWAYCMVGLQERGIFVLKRALNLSPDDRLISEDLAMALIGIGKIEEGNELLEKLGKSKVLI